MKTKEATLIKKLFDSGEKILIYAFPEFLSDVNCLWEKIIDIEYRDLDRYWYCWSNTGKYQLTGKTLDFHIELKHLRITEERTSEILFQKGFRL